MSIPNRKLSRRAIIGQIKREQHQKEKALKERVLRLFQSSLKGNPSATSDLEKLISEERIAKEYFIHLVKKAPKQAYQALRQQRPPLDEPKRSYKEAYSPPITFRKYEETRDQVLGDLNSAKLPHSRSHTQSIARCQSCGAPAIPGDDVCYQCKPE